MASSEGQTVDWATAFESVCRRSEAALEWGKPEQWVHAELYSALKEASARTGWKPFDTEIPYLTYYPVSLPKSTYRDWPSDGAVKWADLCLKNEASNSWCWFELKVRHTGYGGGEKSALDALAKDYVGLCGFDPAGTSSTWTDPDKLTKAYWFDEVLGPHAEGLPHARHYFTSAYLQLAGDFDSDILSEDSIRQKVLSWHQYRSNQSKHDFGLPAMSVMFKYGLPGGHSLLMCQSVACDKANR